MTNFFWRGATSGDWSDAADWTPAGGPPGASDAVTIAATGAAYSVSVSSAEAADALTISNDDATLAIHATGALTVDGLLTNYGTIDVATAGGVLTFGATSAFSNQGLIDVGGGETVTIAGVFGNVSSSGLTGGTYEVNAGSALEFDVSAAEPPIETLAADVILNGAGSNIEQYEAPNGIALTLDSTLFTIAATGELQILGGRNWTIHSLAGSVLTNDGVITLGGGAISGPTSTTGMLSNASGATLVGFGTINVPVLNAGTIEAKGGTLTIAGAFSGSGGLKVDSGATLAFAAALTTDDLITLAGGTLSSPSQPIALAASGHIVGYGNVVAPALLDVGTIEASGGTLNLTTAMAGSGKLRIDGGASLTFETTTLSSGSFSGAADFAGDDATLTLANVTAFKGTLGGFGVGDKLVLPQINANGAYATSADQLVLTENGATVLTLKTDANYSGFAVLSQTVSQGSAFVALPTSATVADYLANKSLYDEIPGGFTIADTADDIVANLSSLGDTHITAIDASGPVSVPVSTYETYQYPLSKVAGGIVVADTLANLLAVNWTAAPAYVNQIEATSGFEAIRSGGISRPLTLESGARLWVVENLTLNDFTEYAGASLGVWAGDTLTLTGGATLADRVGGAGTLDIAGGDVTISGVEAVSNWESSQATLDFATANYYSGAFTASDDTLTLNGGRLALAGTNNLENVTIDGTGDAKILGSLTFANGVTLGGTVTLINLSDDVMQQANALTLGAGTSFDNTAGATWELTGNQGIALGAGSAAVVTNAGLIEQAGNAGAVSIAAAVVNTGTLESASGTLDLAAAVSGTGADVVQGASALEFDASVAAGQTVTLTGGAGRLVLEDPAQFAATIAGFGGAEALDVNGAWTLLGFQENAAGTGGVLSFADGTERASINLAGDFVAANFHAMSISPYTVVTD